VDPVTAKKVVFLKSSELKQHMSGAADSTGAPGVRSSSGAAVATATATVAVASGGGATHGFDAYWPFYIKPFDHGEYVALLSRVWGSSGNS
jgi:hypothetical protein